MKRKIVVLCVLMSNCVVPCMDQRPALTSLEKGAGPFDNLPHDISYSLFAKLNPKEKNAMCKTCKALGSFLSFCHPSELILHKDLCASNKDISSILVKLVFEGNHYTVKTFCTQNVRRDEHYCYRCPRGITPWKIEREKVEWKDEKRGRWFLDPYEIAHYYDNAEMIKTLVECAVPGRALYNKERNFIELGRFPVWNVQVSIDPELLVACISRNTAQVEQIVKDDKFAVDSRIMHGVLSVVIDNDDAQSLAAIISNEKISEYIKSCGHDYLLLSVVCKSKKVIKIFLKNKCFNLNAVTRKQLGQFETWAGTFLDLCMMLQPNDMPPASILKLLIKYGARTLDELNAAKQKEQCLTQ